MIRKEHPLAILINKTQMSVSKLADATGINENTLRTYISGRLPSSENLVTLANYFAVPTDLLLGRCTEEEIRRITENYSEYFMELRKAPYEVYLNGRPTLRTLKELDDKIEVPYPYNIVNKINREPIQHALYANNIQALETAISNLPEKDGDIILLYFKKGQSLREIGEMYSLSSERIRQIISRAVHKLSQPLVRDAIIKGYDTVDKLNEISAQLAEREKEQNKKEQMLTSQRIHLKLIRDKIRKITAENNHWEQIADIIDEINKDDGITPKNILCTPIEKIDKFPSRAYSCLKLAGCQTVGDVKDMLDNDPATFFSIRQFGRKSAQQVINVMNSLLHSDYDIDVLWKKYKQI